MNQSKMQSPAEVEQRPSVHAAAGSQSVQVKGWLPVRQGEAGPPAPGMFPAARLGAFAS